MRVAITSRPFIQPDVFRSYGRPLNRDHEPAVIAELHAFDRARPGFHDLRARRPRRRQADMIDMRQLQPALRHVLGPASRRRARRPPALVRAARGRSWCRSSAGRRGSCSGRRRRTAPPPGSAGRARPTRPPARARCGAARSSSSHWRWVRYQRARAGRWRRRPAGRTRFRTRPRPCGSCRGR